MRSFYRLLTIIFIAILLSTWIPFSTVAQDIDEDVTEEITLSDEELDALLTRVDRFFIDQDMADLTVDVGIYRDPSNRLNEDNIRDGDPSRIAGLTTLVSHYAYTWPDFYELVIMGQLLAGSEIPADSSFFSHLLPIPGAPIYTGELKERFRIRFRGTDEINGEPVYKIRYTAVDQDVEFFNYLVYYISIEHECVVRVESTFESPWYHGNGDGDFYYDEWLGKYLPIYGHGSILFYPNRRSNVWGRWYNWDWVGAEEAAVELEEETEIEEGEETESGTG